MRAQFFSNSSSTQSIDTLAREPTGEPNQERIQKWTQAITVQRILHGITVPRSFKIRDNNSLEMNIARVIRGFAPAISDVASRKLVTLDPSKYPDPIRGICMHNGVLYVMKGYQILRVASDGSVTILAGTVTAGHQDDHASRAKFSKWCRLAADSDGNILVTDPCNYTIRMLHMATERVITIAGQVGLKDYVDSEVGLQAKFRWPLGITVDRDNNVYVADHSALRKLTPKYRENGDRVSPPEFAVSTLVEKRGKYFADVCYDERQNALYFRSEHIIYKYALSSPHGNGSLAEEIVKVEFDMGAMCYDPMTDTILMNRRSLYMLQAGESEDNSDHLIQKLVDDSGERGWALTYDRVHGKLYAATSDHEITIMHLM